MVTRRYSARCSCGWESVWVDSIELAKRAQMNHVPPVSHQTFVLCELVPEPEPKRAS